MGLSIQWTNAFAHVATRINEDRRVNDPSYKICNVGRLAEATIVHGMTGQRPILQGFEV